MERWLEAPLRDLARTRDTITGSQDQAYYRWRSVSGKIWDYTRKETSIGVSDIYAYIWNVCFVFWQLIGFDVRLTLWIT